MNKSRATVGASGLRQKIIQALHRDLAALRIPAHLGSFGEAIDLPRLNADAPGGSVICPALNIEPLYKATPGRIPALARPQRQRMLNHQSSKDFDDILRFRSNCCVRPAARHAHSPTAPRFLDDGIDECATPAIKPEARPWPHQPLVGKDTLFLKRIGLNLTSPA